MALYLYFLTVILGIFNLSCSENADTCFYINHLEFGLIGNCVPESSCANNITAPFSCPSYPSDYTCCFNMEFPGREVRGAWVATVDHIDWPSSPPSDNMTAQQAELRRLFDNLESAGINTIYFQVRPMGDALYASEIEPWSRFVTGMQGKPPSTSWDPLEYAISYAHGKNIELHAWINPYRANIAPTFEGLAPNHMAVQFPDYAYIFGSYVWMDPGAAVVQNRTYDVTIDLVTRYDLDGLHMDDYFYPYPIAGVDFPDNITYDEYLQNGGTLARDDWRRDNVNQLVERLNLGIHQVKPWMKLSISPFGIYRPCHEEGMPCSIQGLDQYSAIYSDPKLWLNRGWVDVLQPQLYWKIDPPQQSYPVLLNWWVEQNTMNRHVYAGNFLSRVLEGWDISEITNQVVISREKDNRDRGSWGNVQFSAKIFNNPDSINHFRERVYFYPALQPTFHWLADAANKSPPKPLTVITSKQGNGISFSSEDKSLHKVVIYKRFVEGWNIYNISSFNIREIQLVKEGAYAISGIDRYGQERGGLSGSSSNAAAQSGSNGIGGGSGSSSNAAAQSGSVGFGGASVSAANAGSQSSSGGGGGGSGSVSNAVAQSGTVAFGGGSVSASNAGAQSSSGGGGSSSAAIAGAESGSGGGGSGSSANAGAQSSSGGGGGGSSSNAGAQSQSFNAGNGFGGISGSSATANAQSAAVGK